MAFEPPMNTSRTSDSELIDTHLSSKQMDQFQTRAACVALLSGCELVVQKDAFP